ncbi:MAG: hypothetical protein WKF97_04385 [Chitinophagaceae bacterium]
MKANHCIAFLMLLPSFFFHNDAEAQNIRGDTIHLEANSVVAVVFPSSPSKAELAINNGQEGLYEISDMGKKSLSIKALKKGAKDQALEVTEGGRKHLFILSYKEGSPARSIDLSTKKKLSARVVEKRKDVSKALNATNSLYDHARTDISNQALWEEVEAKYLQLVNVVDPKDAGVVKSRLEESRKQVQGIKEKRYDEAIKEGQNYHSLKKYGEAKKAYLKTLEDKPGDVQALKYINLTDSVWAKDYVDKGDEAYKAKKYVLAKTNYQEAMSIKADYPSLQNKFNQAKKDADPLIYKIEREKGDEALKATDVEEARRAYDSALSVRPDDRYIENQLKKLIPEEENIELDEKREAAYQSILAAAKSLAGKASNVQEYDLAIKEYERALAMIPTRKFPRKLINELTKIKNGVRAN